MAEDLYQRVTDTIIASIEAGTPAWRKPWTGERGAPTLPRRANGEPYRGINVLMLWLTANDKGYSSRYWLTFKQAKAAGGSVRKGERAATVVKYGTFEREREGENGPEAHSIGYLKSYSVFNAEQIDGLPEQFAAQPTELPRHLGTEADPELEAFFATTGAEIRTTDDPQAFYNPSGDFIHMPPIGTFHTAEGYYGTLAHEACHWTGHKSRLDRLAVINLKGYAFEELIAEIGNCMVCTSLGIEPDFAQSAAYVENWLGALKADKRAIFKAATEAQKAADLLLQAAESVTEEEAA